MLKSAGLVKGERRGYGIHYFIDQAAIIRYHKQIPIVLPVFLQWISYVLPVTYGVDILHGAIHGEHIMSFTLDFLILGVFCIVLFVLSLYNIKRRRIT